MTFFKKKSSIKDNPIHSNEDFWAWFVEHEQTFYKVLKRRKNVDVDFLNKLSPKLDQLREGYWLLAGMYDDTTAELILTVDGVLKNIIFVEELVKSAPVLKRWKFTALKPAQDINNLQIEMEGFKFSKDTLSFYANDHSAHPDEIDITLVHTDYTEEVKEAIGLGTYTFMDNFLGELNFQTSIDSMKIIGPDKVEKALIPIEKLKDFLIWRQKEFIEKYEGTKYNTANDSYSSLEATLNNGKPLLAIVNSVLLDWDRKASHPWILSIQIQYAANDNGMPDNDTYELMNDFEDAIMLELKDSQGYLNVGRETADGSRLLYFACKDFRLPSKVLSQIQVDYMGKLDFDYDLYKDKYWVTFDRYKSSV